MFPCRTGIRIASRGEGVLGPGVCATLPILSFSQDWFCPLGEKKSLSNLLHNSSSANFHVSPHATRGARGAGGSSGWGHYSFMAARKWHHFIYDQPLFRDRGLNFRGKIARRNWVWMSASMRNRMFRWIDAWCEHEFTMGGIKRVLINFKHDWSRMIANDYS